MQSSAVSASANGQVALKKFIAQCTDNTITPPCRSFRLLVLDKDYDKAISEFENIKTKAELEAVGQRYKFYKGAHKDLITMCKGATLRLSDASKRAKRGGRC